MADDRTEMHDLAEKNPTQVQQLKSQWEKWAEKTDVEYKN
jgi:hypothetical protein